MEENGTIRRTSGAGFGRSWHLGVSAVLGTVLGISFRRGFWRRSGGDGRRLIRQLLEWHFRPTSLDNITISERKFPFRVRADLQRAIDRLFVSGTTISYFCGVQKDYCYEGINFTNLPVDGHSPAVSVPPQFEEVDIGEDKPVRCLKNGLWSLEQESSKYAVLLTPAGFYNQITGVQFQIATVNSKDGTAISRQGGQRESGGHIPDGRKPDKARRRTFFPLPEDSSPPRTIGPGDQIRAVGVTSSPHAKPLRFR